jgi:hypothetical protein
MQLLMASLQTIHVSGIYHTGALMSIWKYLEESGNSVDDSVDVI